MSSIKKSQCVLSGSALGTTRVISSYKSIVKIDQLSQINILTRKNCQHTSSHEKYAQFRHRVRDGDKNGHRESKNGSECHF